MSDIVIDWRFNLSSGEVVAFPDCRPVLLGGQPIRVEQGFAHDRLVDSAQTLLDWLRHHADGRMQFKFTFGDHRIRAQRVGADVYALRLIPPHVPDLNGLGFSAFAVNELLSDRHSVGGMILVSGPTGAGKTTTAAATVKTRLQTHGGYCLALEDPIEYDLAGFHGEFDPDLQRYPAYCDQVEALDPSDYRSRVVHAVRSFPAKTRGTLYLGEIRDETTAIEASRMALSGFLVVSTIHAYGVISTIQRILALMGGEESPMARSTLADSLRLIVYQRWNDSMTSLIQELLPASDVSRSSIKNGKLDAIKDELHRVRLQMRAR